MKYLSVIATFALLFAFASAQGLHEKEFAAKLLQQSEDLLSLAQRYIHEYSRHGKNFLLDALQRETDDLERLVVDLRSLQSEPETQPERFHLHVIEEQILYHSNRITEELEVMEEIFNHHHHSNKTAAQLIHEAEAVIKEANEALAENRVSPRNINTVKLEIVGLEKLIAQVKSKPEDADLSVEEELLARLEKSIRQLINRRIPTRPTEKPTHPTTVKPTVAPTTPVKSSTPKPTVHPSTHKPTVQPTTHRPTVQPSTHRPTVQPSTHRPTVQPSTHRPTVQPSTHRPTVQPSTHRPTVQPSTHRPTVQPSTHRPTVKPSTHRPTVQPSTHRPTVQPSTHKPTVHPTGRPTVHSTVHPSTSKITTTKKA